MPLLDLILPEFDQEAATTRRVLARVADDKLNLKPHEKSWTLAELSTHIANALKWTVTICDADSFDLSPAGGPLPKEIPVQSGQELLALFEKNAADARACIAKMSDQDWLKPWSLLANGATMMTMPKIAVFRSFIMNHSIHHRGQLSVYLRISGTPVPSIYGPSADEQS